MKNGAHVSIIARNPALLEEARAEIMKFVSLTAEQKVSCYSGNLEIICIYLLSLFEAYL